jgi:hypothetical protein
MMLWVAICACLSIGGYTFVAAPAEYAHEPTRPYVVKRVTEQLIGIMCGAVLGRVVLGCTLDDGEKPVIFVKDGMSPELDAAVLAHEKAHVNGWEHA